MNASVSTTATPASLWLRIVAGVYDLLPLIGLWFFAGVLALAISGGTLDPHRLAHKVLVQAMVLLLSAAYFIVSWTRGGQTIGMRAWRLRAVRADGSALGPGRASLRFLVALASLGVLGLGFWWALADREKRTWHDIAAGTAMVRIQKMTMQK